MLNTLLVVMLISGSVAAKVMPVKFDQDRNRLIAYLLGHQLPYQHFSHEMLDDKLSRAAFALYLRQLDPGKRFLLEKDVQQLKAFQDHIDDELRNGHLVLPDAGRQFLNQRIREVQNMIDPLLDRGFDPHRKEYLQVDPKKLDYARNEAALHDRWRRILKMQVIEEYLSLLEKKAKKLVGKRGRKEQVFALKLPSKVTATQEWQAAMAKVRKRNQHYLHRLLQETRQDHYNRYFDAIARAYDPHTTYMPPTSREDFDIHMSGSLEGIGALLREEDGRIKVVRIIPGSAAERQGELQAEDTILAVAEKDGDPVDISDMRIRDAVSYIRGPKGTEVRLTVLKPDGTRKVIPIVRDVVQIEESYVKSTVLKNDSGKNIGYLRIPSFYRDFSGRQDGASHRNVTDDTRRELVRLKQKGIQGLILDLRNNGGGALTDAVDVSGLFIPTGPIVQVKNSQGMIRVLNDEDESVVWDGPLIVLVNQFSASASEILAAALQDYGRALIIGGEHTHGKGTVQALLDLNRNLPLLHLKKYADLGALKITIQKFYRINGGSTQYRGVEPDIVVPSMLDYLKSGEKYMDHSLPWDQVKNVGFTRWQGAHFDVKRARRDAGKWVSASSQFAKIRTEEAKAKKRSEKTRVSIDIDGMLRERQEREAARREAEAAGIVQPDDEAEATGKKKKKALREEVARDPFVLVALYLMDDALPAGHELVKAR